MYELIQISEHDYYIDCPSKMGIVRTGDEDVVMIDSGNDKDAPVVTDITELADINAAAINAVRDRILEICSEPKAFEHLLASLFEGTGLKMNPVQHVLTGSTVKAYLSYLLENGKIGYEFVDNMMYWKTVQEN